MYNITLSGGKMDIFQARYILYDNVVIMRNDYDLELTIFLKHCELQRMRLMSK